MAFYNFNPFPVGIKDLEGKHLNVLRDVTEGWYVDYKQEILQIKKISKQLSSFSNQYGGWLFFGVIESDERKAGRFSGIPKESVESSLLRIREASTAHVNPSVYYEEKVIYGPVSEISLEKNSAIIVVYIPEGANPPYIDSSGSIYRRLADQSYPVKETDRHVLDKLWEKGSKRWMKTKEFIKRRRDITNPNTPVIYVHFLTNPRFNKHFESISYDDFRDIFSGQDSNLGLSMPMDSIHSVQGGFVAKQTKGNNPFDHVPFIRWWHDGNAMIVIPLNTITFDSLKNSNVNFIHGIEFLKELQHQGLSEASICDFNYFLITLSCLFNQLTEVYKLTNNKEKIFSSFCLENAEKMIPFIDDPEYLSQVKKIGAAIIEDKQVRVPWDLDERWLIEIIPREEEFNDLPRGYSSMVDVMPIFASLFNSIGIVNRIKDFAKFLKVFSTNKYENPKL